MKEWSGSIRLEVSHGNNKKISMISTQVYQKEIVHKTAQ